MTLSSSHEALAWESLGEVLDWCPSIAWLEYITERRVHTNIILYSDSAVYIFDEIPLSLSQRDRCVHRCVFTGTQLRQVLSRHAELTVCDM